MLGLVVDGRKRLKVRDEDGGGLIPGLSARNPRSSRTERQLQTEHEYSRMHTCTFSPFPSCSPSLHRTTRSSSRFIVPPGFLFALLLFVDDGGRQRRHSALLSPPPHPLTVSVCDVADGTQARGAFFAFAPRSIRGPSLRLDLGQHMETTCQDSRLNGRHEKKGPSKILEPKGEPEGAKCKKGGRSNDELKGEGGRVEKTFVLQSEGGRQSGWE